MAVGHGLPPREANQIGHQHKRGVAASTFSSVDAVRCSGQEILGHQKPADLIARQMSEPRRGSRCQFPCLFCKGGAARALKFTWIPFA